MAVFSGFRGVRRRLRAGRKDHEGAVFAPAPAWLAGRECRATANSGAGTY